MIKKVLCVGPFKAPSNALLRTFAFEKLGYEVVRVDVSGPLQKPKLVSRLLMNRVSRKLWQRLHLQQMLLKIKRNAPDLIFVEKGIGLSAKDLALLKKTGPTHMKIAHLNPDDPFGEHYVGWEKLISAIPLYDTHFVPKEINREEYAQQGASSVYVYDRSFAPDFHHPVELSSSFEKKRFGCDIGFIGAYAPYRESVLAVLVDAGLPLALWGEGWSKGKYWKQLKPFWRGGNQVGVNYSKAIAGMKIALHFIRRENRDYQDSRSFEIPACGSFMLAERTPDHERLFIADEEAVFFDSADQCLAQCRFYLEHSLDRKRISQSGYRKVFESGYSYESRLQEMLEAIEENNPRARTWRGVR